jgi:hypothetical protein
MAAACCYRADASSAGLASGMRAGSYDEDSPIELAGKLHAHPSTPLSSTPSRNGGPT